MPFHHHAMDSSPTRTIQTSSIPFYFIFPSMYHPHHLITSALSITMKAPQQAAMGELDPAFIQELEHRPKSAANEAQGIPLIDLSVSETEAVTHIGSACKNWGFFQLINHGFPSEKLERLLEAAKEFFALPKEEKRKASRDEESASGYYDTEHTKNIRDWKEVFDYSLQDPVLVPAISDDGDIAQWSNRWPDRPNQFRQICEEYSEEVEKLSFRIMELIALSLGLPRKRFNRFFENHQTSFVRLNYYPPCPSPELALGVGRHKDSGALTVLAQDDVGGLEVKRKTDGEWVRVKPTPNAYIINIGDIFQVWSNGIYESVEHRVVVNPDKERYSLPFFFNPSQRVTVEPLPELINSDKKAAKYKAYNWGRFLVTRRHGDFKKLDVENIQIEHFVVDEQKG